MKKHTCDYLKRWYKNTRHCLKR